MSDDDFFGDASYVDEEDALCPMPTAGRVATPPNKPAKAKPIYADSEESDDGPPSPKSSDNINYGSPPPKSSKPKQAKTPAAKAAPKKAPAKKAAVKNQNGEENEDPMSVFTNLDTAAKSPAGKRINIEKTYQKKTQLEHILLRPDTYIGSVERTDPSPMWVWDSEESKMSQKEITYVPGLYKIFDEIVVNAADNKQRDSKMNTLKVTIDREKNEISVWNNGKGIPVVQHKGENMWVPEMIFGTLLTSSNYDDSQKKVTGGRNGYGAKLCNIFSSEFTVETSSTEFKHAFRQTWFENMGRTGTAKVSAASSSDYTKITFKPDLIKFKMEKLEDDIVSMMERRAYDIAGCLPGVKVFLNGQKLPIAGFAQYVQEYVKGRVDIKGEPLKLVHERVSDRWEVAVTVSDDGFQHVSFVNSIATTKGGRHVDYIADQLVVKLIEQVKKKLGKSSITIKPNQVRSHLWVFVNCLIENPTFDSQTKETMTLQPKNFGSVAKMSEKFYGQCLKSGIVESILSWVRAKELQQMDKKCSGKKTSKLKGLPKLEDANDAGTKNSHKCTLILTEGDSAKALAVSGLGVVGRDHFGVYPLRGKMLNVREATHKQIIDNAESNAVIKILGLQYKKTYETEADMATLRYGKVMIMADQDQDGSHIKGLVINFIHCNWPSLLRNNFVDQFITPIVKATKGQQSVSFYSLPEYVQWKADNANWKSYRIKYYKGLGTSTAKEAKEYFTDMARHRIKFRYAGKEDDEAILLAFSKKKIEERKDWLTDFMRERRERRLTGGAEQFLYNAQTTTISFGDFVNRELVLFSNMDNERSIPSLVDGLKPGQRKVLFTCFKRNDKREVKVAQLAGSVAEQSAYHHGEQSLMSTIVNLAQNFVGSNNINVLQPIGQFGTRLQGGKDSASARYIFTMLSPVTRTMFPILDDPVLNNLLEDNQRIEPEWYAPILPLVLVNGAQGIGTGWSTNIPNYNPREIVDAIRILMHDSNAHIKTLHPWYKGFNGTIERLDAVRYICHGEMAVIDETTIEITELPVKVWTTTYKESVLEPMLGGDAKLPQIITDYKEYHTDCTVKFIVKLPAQVLANLERQPGGLHKAFKLQTNISTNSMVVFDSYGCLRRFETVDQILLDFVGVRRSIYTKRKTYMIGLLNAQSRRLSNQARFIMEKIEGKIVMENKKKKFIVDRLVERNYDADPVKVWKEAERVRIAGADADEVYEEVDDADENDDEAMETPDTVKVLDKTAQRLSDFDYLVTMQLIKLSEEEKDKLLRERDTKKEELEALQGKSETDLWTADLDAFIEALDKQDAKDKADLEGEISKVSKAMKDNNKGGRSKGKAKLNVSRVQCLPSADAIRVVPRIDPKTKETAEKAVALKERKKTTVSKKERDSADEDDLDLLACIAKKSPTLAKTVKSKIADKKRPPTNTLDKFVKKVSPGVTKKKVVDAWESNSDESEGESEAEFTDDDDDVMPTTTKRAPNKRQLPSDDDEEDDEVSPVAKKRQVGVIDLDDESHGTTSSATSSRGPPTNGADVFDMMDEEEDSPVVAKKAVIKKAVVKKAAAPAKAKPAAKKPAPKKVISSDDDDEEMADSGDDAEVVVLPTTSRGGGRRAAAMTKKYVESDDEEEDTTMGDDDDVYDVSD